MDFESKKNLQIGLFSLLLVVGVLGNTLVIYVYSCATRKRFLKFERLILILAIVDIIASILNPAYFIYLIKTNYTGWPFGDAMCHVIPALGPIFSGISLGLILLMAIDRDRAVCTPFKKQFTLRTIYKAMGATVLLSVAVNVPYMHFQEVIKYKGREYCVVNTRKYDTSYPESVVSINIISDTLFLLIFVVTTVRVCLKLTAKSIFNYPKTKEFRARETRRILKMIISMGVCFIVLIFPRDILQTVYFIHVLHPPRLVVKDYYMISAMLKLLHTSNSVVNVFLYSLLNRRFRRDVLRIVMKFDYIRQLSGYSGDTDSSFYSENENSSRKQSRKQSDLNQSRRMEVLRRISGPKMSVQIDKRETERIQQMKRLQENTGLAIVEHTPTTIQDPFQNGCGDDNTADNTDYDCSVINNNNIGTMQYIKDGQPLMIEDETKISETMPMIAV